VIIEDADSGQLEFHWIGSVLDLKRLSAMDISQGDFLKYRSSVYFRAAPAWLCKQAVEQLFEDLRNRAPIPKIAKHFSPQADLRSLLPFLIQNLTPTESGEGPASLADVKALQISEDGALVFARMLLPVDQAGTSTVREQGYYFLFDVGELNALIRRVVLISSSPVGNQNRWEIPPEFVRHGSPQQWSDQNWFAEPIGMPRFLAHQIARRVRYDLGSLPEMSGFGIAGEFLENEFHFQFRLAQMAQPGALAPAALAKKRDKETKKLDPKTPEGLAGLIVQTAAQVIHSYEFKNFKGLSVVDAESGKSWQFKADQLDIYRRKPVPLPSVQP
ncbi:MAG: hypothetical protein HY594_02360, partial [Candidatus Omnitrophica bacterium]|nr:hypothetical protein [Candidatus Omnitrophota bacterium]